MPGFLPLRRMRDISRVFLRHGLDHLLRRRHRPTEEEIPRLWERIRLVLEDLGPTFVKFGQILSNRVDLLPPPLILELQKLQYRVKPFAPELARRILEREWHRPVESVLADFDPHPSSAASISQVHRAVLKSGEPVAVKIQRPGVLTVIREDLKLMRGLTELLQLFLRHESLNPHALLYEFEQAVIQELDFRTEVRALLRLGAILDREKDLRVPQVHADWCTSRVLVMEWVEGWHPTRVGDLERAGLTSRQFLEKVARSYQRQIFRHGYFHADPHLGNLMVTGSGQIYLLDAGQVGTLYKKQRDILNELVVGLVSGDRVLIVQCIWELCTGGEDQPSVSFEQELGRLVETYLEVPLKDIDLVQFFTSVLDLFAHHHIRIPAQFFVLVKTLITLDGLARRFYPEFQLLDWLSANLGEMYANPETLRENVLQLLGNTYETYKLLKSLPADVRSLIRTAKAGRIQIVLNEKNLENTMRELGRITNRLAASLIITGLILAGTVLIQSPAQPFLFGVPLLAAPLFGGAILMGIWLLWSIWRSRTL